MSARRIVLVLGIGLVIAIALAIAAFFFPLNNDGNNNGFVPILAQSLLYVYDNTTQPVNVVGSNRVGDWTNVRFNNRLLPLNGWGYTLGSTNIVSNTEGLHSVYFSIQVQVNNLVTPSISPFCKACNMRYMIRALQQWGGVGEFREVAGSRTYSSGTNFFLSKQFLIHTELNDVLRFQFTSLCNNTALYPLSFLQTAQPTPVQNEYPASATLLIM